MNDVGTSDPEPVRSIIARVIDGWPAEARQGLGAAVLRLTARQPVEVAP